MVAVRSSTEVLSTVVTVIIPSLVPDEGEAESQYDVPVFTVHFVLEVMLNVFCSAEDIKVKDSGDTVSDATNPPCVTFMVFIIPCPLTVIIDRKSTRLNSSH